MLLIFDTSWALIGRGGNRNHWAEKVKREQTKTFVLIYVFIAKDRIVSVNQQWRFELPHLAD